MKNWLFNFVCLTSLCLLVRKTYCETSENGKTTETVETPMPEAINNTTTDAKIAMFANEYHAAEFNSSIYVCSCGEESIGCEYRNGNKICHCKKGFAQDWLGMCQECSCGEGSVGCEYQNWNKVCHCKKGFAQDMFDLCRECDCGPHGKCVFEKIYGFHRKECHCNEGYAEFGGLCVECSCGSNGNCTIDQRAKKKCACEFGYGSVLGTCTPCGCGPEDGCIFNKATNRCYCQRGFEDVNGLCKDINECLMPNICPKYSTCLNYPGTYTCQCKNGFRRPLGKFDPQKDLCQDIDECFELDIPCLYESTTCVNIPGSYRCDCKPGYEPFSSLQDGELTKYNDCIEDPSYSRNLAYIVMGICAAIIVTLLILVHFRSNQKCLFSRRLP